MEPITSPETRGIIKDFANEIRAKRLSTVKPSKTVINFRDDRSAGVERLVWRVPIGILRYRKDNGRIASDVLDHETNVGILDETDEEAQKLIRGFLERKDPERTLVLKMSIMHDGQVEPTIITSDGFLINGNRRKMVMEALCKEYPGNESYAYMNAVILPGEGEEGGPPTLLEIEKLENRYQLQSDGKSEYYGFDRALSIKRKIEIGLSLEEQLRDDPLYVKATSAEMERAVKEYQERYLEPLECVDRYLKQFRRDGLYSTISSGMSDPEGRWQAFIDYSNTYKRYFQNDKRRTEHGIEEAEVGDIEEAAFDIIRLRSIPNLPKVHMIMRELPKYCRTKEGKKEIVKIAHEVEPTLPTADNFDADGNPLSHEIVDAKWAAKNREVIIRHTVRAEENHTAQKEKETPLDLLEAAYKKLTHDDMDLKTVAVGDYGKARGLVVQIQKTAHDLEAEIYRLDKEYKKLDTRRS